MYTRFALSPFLTPHAILQLSSTLPLSIYASLTQQEKNKQQLFKSVTVFDFGKTLAQNDLCAGDEVKFSAEATIKYGTAGNTVLSSTDADRKGCLRQMLHIQYPPCPDDFDQAVTSFSEIFAMIQGFPFSSSFFGSNEEIPETLLEFATRRFYGANGSAMRVAISAENFTSRSSLALHTSDARADEIEKNTLSGVMVFLAMRSCAARCFQLVLSVRKSKTGRRFGFPSSRLIR